MESSLTQVCISYAVSRLERLHPTRKDGAMVDMLAGKVAIVTGAGQGIGRGIARMFATEGARVAVVDLDKDRGAAVADEIR
ncbi:MAG TPA: SDR family NAD(P)-dependent oxidoreductase, partial [Acidimicrobiales bacterium]|nr:SDR family NAD(P)-dependent oxidoreductase [Acidimicrobiales bacterium]